MGRSLAWEGNFNIDSFLNPWLPRNVLPYLPYPLAYILGWRKQAPKGNCDAVVWFWNWVGAFAGVAVIEAVFTYDSYFTKWAGPTIVGSFGASSVLVFGAIEAPFAQPRAFFGGHTLSAITGVIVTKLFRTNEQKFVRYRWLCGAIACATANVVMGVTRTVHPPSGATALLAAVQDEITYNLGWYYIPEVMLSCVLMLGVAIIVNNVQRRYPVYWWTGAKLGPPESTPEGEGDIERSSSYAQETSPGTEQRTYDVIISTDKIHVPTGVVLSEGERHVLHLIRLRLNDLEDDSPPRSNLTTAVTLNENEEPKIGNGSEAVST